MRLSQKQLFLIISAAIVIATLIAYEPVRHNGFVAYDDDKYITENPEVGNGLTQQSVKWAFTQPHHFMWHPLTTISHMLDCELFGLAPLGHHLINVMFHIVNALLLFWIVNRLTGTIWASAFVAAVFALHPLQVESVAWASERKTVLSGLFWLLTMAVYIRYTRRPNISRYILVFLVFGLCIMTKPVVVTLPLALLLLDYWPLDRVGKVSARRLVIEKIPLLMLSVILSVITFAAQHKGGIVAALGKISLENRIGNMFTSYISYIGKMLWPSGLAVIYPYRNISFWNPNTIVCIILFVLILFLSIYIGRRKKYAAVGWLWYVGTLVPVIGLIQSGAQAMANRYMYIPMLGLLVIIGWAVKDFVVNRPRIKIAAAIMSVIAMLSLLVLTRMQVRHWQDTMTLFDYTLKVTENNYVAENIYGITLYDAGRVNEAKLHLNKAVTINPLFWDARCNICRVFFKEGKLNEAITCFNEVLRQNANFTDAHYNLGIALGKQKRYDEAIEHFAKVLQLNPTYPDAHNKMGFAFMQAGKYDLAIENFTRAIELRPDNIDVLNKLAWLLAAVDDTSIHNAQKAVEFAQRGCELTGYNDPMLLDTLAVAYAAAGRFDEAKATAEKALGLAKETGREKLAGEIQNRIKLYQVEQPYRQK